MTTETELRQQLIDAAATLLASAPDDPKLEAFKAASAFYLGIAKQEGKKPGPSETKTFADIKRQIDAGRTTEGHA